MIVTAALLALMAPPAQSTPDEAVDRYGRAIATGSAADLRAAFQPSAMMYCTDGRDIRGTYQSQWQDRLESGGPPELPIATHIEWRDAGATTALVRASAVRGAKTFTDYILLARLAGVWRIVGKLCQDRAQPDEASAVAVGAVVDTKMASDRSWDADRLAQSIDDRALIMSVEKGELVAASLAEWQARYVDRRRTSPGSAAIEIDRNIDARGSIGVARWSFKSPSGAIWTDRALVMKTPSGWRMMALLFVKEP
ncbi:MAG: nuclear transport factor 2 family protein [Sphingomonas sp.]|jgi:hypothetical protein|uniref:nuclear transport factor 2 family protein n=1 Tax=Sphingomonas sp. TaxID=28214 RepID=UPI0035698A21